MPVLSSLELIQISLPLAIGSFSIFKVLFERDFQKRYARFRRAFQRWLNSQILSFISGLQNRASTKTDPSEIIKEMDAWVKRQANVVDVSEDYNQLDKQGDYILYSLGGAILFAFLGLAFPDRINAGVQEPVFWVDLGAWALVFGVFFIFRYMLGFRALSRRMTQVEAGIPFERIFEKELSEESSGA